MPLQMEQQHRHTGDKTLQENSFTRVGGGGWDVMAMGFDRVYIIVRTGSDTESVTYSPSDLFP